MNEHAQFSFSKDNRRSIDDSHFTEAALSEKFGTIHCNELRYISAWGKWMRFDGQRWRAEQTGYAMESSKVLCVNASAFCSEGKLKFKLESRATITAVEALARVDRRLIATVDQWDKDDWLLNTPGGVVDLRTAKIRPHLPEDFMTKMTAVPPGGQSPPWQEFLKRVTGNDAELAAFLQRMAGYALTGDTSAHALFFLFGLGANGKSVFLDTLAGLMGDYAKTSAIETFTASNTDRHPTDIASLQGSRLAIANETDEGRRWAESRIKSLTGGDKISARFMRQDAFEFQPKLKLVIVGNHKPGLRSVDVAMRRRFHLVPFTVTIPSEERDPHLKEKLFADGAGILQWALNGCLEWQRIGLRPPQAVTDATADYLEGEDSIAAWLLECCVDHRLSREVRDEFTLSSDLFANWKGWCGRSGEFAGSNKTFSQRLEAKGFLKKKGRLGTAFLDLILSPSQVYM